MQRNVAEVEVVVIFAVAATLVGEFAVILVMFVAIGEDRRLHLSSLCADFIYLAIAGRLPTCLLIFFHTFLLLANSCISEYVKYSGKSINRPPFDPLANWVMVASFTRRVSSSRSRCPSQTKRRDLIARVKSNVLVDALASQ